MPVTPCTATATTGSSTPLAVDETARLDDEDSGDAADDRGGPQGETNGHGAVIETRPAKQPARTAAGRVLPEPFQT